MSPNVNVIGRNIGKLRYQKGWTQDELAVKMQLLGCYMTRQIITNIENRLSSVSDKRIEYFAEVFDVQVGDLFPQKRHFSGRVVGLDEKRKAVSKI
jgi:transcriptional regulator with XRE-family HTH domain